MLRWSLRLSEFHFTVERRPGTQIRHSDALSTAVQSIAHERELSREEVKEEQAKDKFCHSLEVGSAKGKSEYFADEDGVIYPGEKWRAPASRTQQPSHYPVTVAHP